jgi:HAMP domain-containing protein
VQHSKKVDLYSMFPFTLASRLILTVMATAFLTHITFVGLTVTGVERSLERQSQHLALTYSRHLAASTDIHPAIRTSLDAARTEITRIAAEESTALITWLFTILVVSLMLFAGVIMLTTQRLFMPLASMATALRALAQGNWKSRIQGLERRDEIGDIARAVSLLQKSLEERDRLRQDIAQAEAMNRRRQTLEESIRKFDRQMRVELLEVNDGVDRMEDMARDLARYSAIAEGEAAEVAFVTDQTSGLLRRISGEIVGVETALTTFASQDYTSISQTGLSYENNIKNNMLKEKSDKTLEEAIYALRTLSVEGQARNTSGLQGEPSHSESIIRQLDAALLTLSTMTTDDPNLTNLRCTLHDALHKARAWERQEQGLHHILVHLDKAGTGAASASSSVRRLRSTIEETRGASVKVVTTAEAMAEKAVNLNLAVKSFLHEVLVQ